MGEAAAWPSKPHQRDANATAPAGTDEAWLGPPFGQLQMLAACILTFICTAGVLLNTVLLLAMSRSRYSAAPANVPHVHLAMINLAACVGKLAVSIPSLILGHYPFAHLGCQIEGFLVQVLSGLAKLTVLAAAISPYFVVALSRPSMSRSQSVAVLVACWLFMLVTSSFPFMRSHSREDQDQAAGVTVPPYVVQASGVYCHLDFTSNDPLTLTVCVADAIIISIMPFVIGGLYGHISIKLRQLASRMRTKRKKRTAAELESMMARRGLVMSASQIVCWFVSAFRMCSELLNRRRVHPLANVVEYILIALSHVVYVVAMIFDDKRIRSALWSMGEQMVGCLCPADDPAFGMSDETLDREADHDTVARSSRSTLATRSHSQLTAQPASQQPKSNSKAKGQQTQHLSQSSRHSRGQSGQHPPPQPPPQRQLYLSPFDIRRQSTSKDHSGPAAGTAKRAMDRSLSYSTPTLPAPIASMHQQHILQHPHRTSTASRQHSAASSLQDLPKLPSSGHQGAGGDNDQPSSPPAGYSNHALASPLGSRQMLEPAARDSQNSHAQDQLGLWQALPSPPIATLTHVSTTQTHTNDRPTVCLDYAGRPDTQRACSSLSSPPQAASRPTTGLFRHYPSASLSPTAGSQVHGAGHTNGRGTAPHRWSVGSETRPTLASLFLPGRARRSDSHNGSRSPVQHSTGPVNRSLPDAS